MGKVCIWLIKNVKENFPHLSPRNDIQKKSKGNWVLRIITVFSWKQISDANNLHVVSSFQRLVEFDIHFQWDCSVSILVLAGIFLEHTFKFRLSIFAKYLRFLESTRLITDRVKNLNSLYGNYNRQPWNTGRNKSFNFENTITVSQIISYILLLWDKTLFLEKS